MAEGILWAKKEETYEPLLYAECKLKNDYFLCEAGKLVDDHIEPIRIKVRSLSNDGCSGVKMALDKDSVVLKRRWESLSELKKLDAEEIWYDRDLFEMHVMDGKAFVLAEEPYPCE